MQLAKFQAQTHAGARQHTKLQALASNTRSTQPLYATVSDAVLTKPPLSKGGWGVEAADAK